MVNVSFEMSIFLPLTSANVARYIFAIAIFFGVFPILPLLLLSYFYLLACSLFVYFYLMKLFYCCYSPVALFSYRCYSPVPLFSFSDLRKKSHSRVAFKYQIDLIVFLVNLCFNAWWIFDVNPFFDWIAFQKSVNRNA